MQLAEGILASSLVDEVRLSLSELLQDFLDNNLPLQSLLYNQTESDEGTDEEIKLPQTL